jgi:cbb3-type cytochrome oxidase subunit 3
MDLVTLYMTVRSYWIVWVMLLFVGMIVWVYWPKRRAARPSPNTKACAPA